MVSDQIRRTLSAKSNEHQLELQRLGQIAAEAPLSPNAIILEQTRQIRGIHTLLMNPTTSKEDYIFYFDRIVTILFARAIDFLPFTPTQVVTPQNHLYMGLHKTADMSAVVILRGGSTFETGLRRTIPDCRTGRILIQTNFRTGEPELHYRALPTSIKNDGLVMLLDPQMSTGGAALMAVRVLVDHGVPEDRIIFVTYMAGRNGVNRVLNAFPAVRVVIARMGEDMEDRWVETRYLGC
jgi:uridine kinase